MEESDYQAYGKEITRRAAHNRSFKAAAAIVAGAVDNVYERVAADALRAVRPEDASVAWADGPPEDVLEAIEFHVLIAASEAVIRFHGRVKL